MKKSTFNVAIDSMLEFCGVLESNELSNEIVGVTDDEILIEVSYDSSERAAIFELIEITNDDV
jgi:hypothetical protein